MNTSADSNTCLPAEPAGTTLSIEPCLAGSGRIGRSLSREYWAPEGPKALLTHSSCEVEPARIPPILSGAYRNAGKRPETDAFVIERE